MTKGEKDKEPAIKKKATAVAEQKRKKKDKKKAKIERDEQKRAKKPGNKAKDRGPFGVAPSEDWETKKGRRDEESEESGSSTGDSSFQKAPSSRSHHLRQFHKAASDRETTPASGAHVLPGHHDTSHERPLDAENAAGAEGGHDTARLDGEA